jgi:hypothetical protein
MRAFDRVSQPNVLIQAGIFVLLGSPSTSWCFAAPFGMSTALISLRARHLAARTASLD